MYTFSLKWFILKLNQVLFLFAVSALISVKGSLIDNMKHLNNWKRGDPCTSHWTGVFCNISDADGYLHVRELQVIFLHSVVYVISNFLFTMQIHQLHKIFIVCQFTSLVILVSLSLSQIPQTKYILFLLCDRYTRKAVNLWFYFYGLSMKDCQTSSS